MIKIISQSMLLSVGVIVINFIFKIYLSYQIEKDIVGVFYTFLDVISVAALFFTGYKDSMIKLFSEGNFLVVKAYIYRNYSLLTLIFIPILYLLYEKSVELFNVYLLLLFFVLTQISNYYSYFNVAHQNYNSMLFEKTVKAIALISSFTLYVEFLDTVLALILAYITQLLAHISYLYLTSANIFFIKPIKTKKEIYSKFLRNYKLATVTSFFGSISIYLSSIVMLYLYQDNKLLADYQVVVKSIFFALVVVFVHPIAAYTFPELSKLIAKKEYQEVIRIDKKLKKYLFFFMAVIFISLPLTKYVISFVFPDEYKNSFTMLNMMLPMLPFIIYTSFSINILKSFNRFELVLYIRMIGTFLFFFSIILLHILNFDARNIIYSLDISFFSMFIFANYYKKKVIS